MPDRGELLVEHDFLTSPASGVHITGTPIDLITYPYPGFSFWNGSYMWGGPYGIHCQTSYQADESSGPYGGQGPIVGPLTVFDRNMFGLDGTECMGGTFTYRGDPTAPIPNFWVVPPPAGPLLIFTNTVNVWLAHQADATLFPPNGALTYLICGVNQRDGRLSVGEITFDLGGGTSFDYTLGTITATDPVGPHVVEFHHTATEITATTPWDTVTHSFSTLTANLLAAVQSAGGVTDGSAANLLQVGLTLDEDAFGFGPTVAIAGTSLYLCTDLVDYIRLFPRDDDLGIGYSGQGRNPVRAAQSGPTSVQRSYRNHNRVTRSGYQ